MTCLYNDQKNALGGTIAASAKIVETSHRSSHSARSSRFAGKHGWGGALLGAGLLLTATPSWADPVPYPGMTGPLSANPNPTTLDAGPLGEVKVTGVVSGVAQYQDSVFPGDRKTLADLSNGQVFIQKTDGPVQFFVQAGAYSLPDLGLPYLKATTATQSFYGAIPQAFIKIAPTSNFSVMAGKLPTLIGAEYTFSFENMNIQRGLVWNQENAVNRGVQANYSHGPLTVSVSLNDGFYSNKWNWVWGSVSYAIDKSNTLTVIGGGNTGHTSRSTLATPLAQNNGQIYNIIYAHTSGPWTIEPYFQYTRIPVKPEVGITHAASTYGGALFLKYSFNEHFHVAARGEYIATTGTVANGAPNLMYGPGSKAWSFTITPTYQKGIFFIRGEYSHVSAYDITPGLAMGPLGNDKKQNRLLVEGGFLF